MGIYPSTHKTLLSRIQEGDEISWAEFYDRYSPVVLAISSRFGLSQTEAEDIRQEVMLKIFQKRLIFSYREEKARFRTYFNQILHSCIVDHCRKVGKYKLESAEQNIPDQPVTPEEVEVFDEEWRRQRLQEALDILRDHVESQTFLAFHMAVFQQKTVKEITAFLQISTAQVYLAKSRCIAKLKTIVEEMKAEEPELELHWDGK